MPRPHGGKLVDQVLKDHQKEKAEETAKQLEQIEVSAAIATDVENIAKGVFSPLQGFMNREELDSILDHNRLPDDTAWTIPILLDAPPAKAHKLTEGDQIALTHSQKPLALLNLQQKYTYNKEKIAKATFGTTDPAHPGVAATKAMEDTLLAGQVTLINAPKGPYDQYKLQPLETRILFQEKGWETIVGFQTRNPPHIGHEYVQKTALAFVDGVFINPVIGKKKKGDFKDQVIIDSYNALMKNYYLKESVVMSILPFEMRYAGPKEAIFHAIVRKNFGCTHFIVGRDHAGVGNYYGPYDAQHIFNDFPDLGITPLFFKSFFYCNTCNTVTNEKACPHSPNQHINFSGTQIRHLFNTHQLPPPHLMRPEVAQTIAKHPNPFVA